MQRFLISVFLVAALVAGTKGLECYSCYHVSQGGNGEDLGVLKPHASCENGKVPDSSVRAPCKTATGPDGNEIEPICVQVHATMNLEGVGPVEATARGCANVDPVPDNACGQTTVQDLKDVTYGDMKDALNLLPVPPNTPGRFCHCNSDNCNPAPMVTPGGMAVVALGAVLVALKSML